MKQLRTFFLLMLFAGGTLLNVHAQAIIGDDNVIYIPKYKKLDKEQKKTGKTYINVDVDPWHKEGQLEAVVDKYKSFPANASKENMQGNSVRLKFVVGSDGSINDIEVLTSVSPSVDTAVVEVIRSLPRMRPAMVNDVNVPVEYYHSVSFEDEIERPKNILETTGFWLPKYKGGVPALMRYMQKNLRYPREAALNAEQGVVLVRFVVSSAGEVIEAEVLRKVSPRCDAEALRVVRNMKNWLPAVNDGKYVSCYFTLPVKFALTRR